MLVPLSDGSGMCPKIGFSDTYLKRKPHPEMAHFKWVGHKFPVKFLPYLMNFQSSSVPAVFKLHSDDSTHYEIETRQLTVALGSLLHL